MARRVSKKERASIALFALYLREELDKAVPGKRRAGRLARRNARLRLMRRLS